MMTQKTRGKPDGFWEHYSEEVAQSVSSSSSRSNYEELIIAELDLWEEEIPFDSEKGTEDKTTMTDYKEERRPTKTAPETENVMVQVSAARGEKRSESTAIKLKAHLESTCPKNEKLRIIDQRWKVEKFLESSKQFDIEVENETKEDTTTEPFFAITKTI